MLCVGPPACCGWQGADTVIYERLARGHPLNESLREPTLAHMEEYGSAGLRTLCLSYTELDPDFYDECVRRGGRLRGLAFLGGGRGRGQWCVRACVCVCMI